VFFFLLSLYLSQFAAFEEMCSLLVRSFIECLRETCQIHEQSMASTDSLLLADTDHSYAYHVGLTLEAVGITRINSVHT
jgi:hypothetical protein